MDKVLAVGSNPVVFNQFLFLWLGLLASMIFLNIRRPRSYTLILDVVMSGTASFCLVFMLFLLFNTNPFIYGLWCLTSIVPLSLVIALQARKERGTMYWTASAVVYVMLVILLWASFM